MASSDSAALSPLQRDVLNGFFERESGFYLTGGAALAGFHLGHRPTDDLDLFTADEGAFLRGPHVMQELAAALAARMEIRQDAPAFKRFVLERPPESLVVDLVLDRTPPAAAAKLVRGKLRIDPPEEVLVNELTALVGRTEERDLVDVYFLERAGFRVEDALAPALRKDGGCTPAQLAWLLAQVSIPDDAALPGGVPAPELRRFLDDLIVRLRRAALPPAGA